MTLNYIAEKSFVASLEVTNTDYPNPVGTWEFKPGYNGTTQWLTSSWLTTSRAGHAPVKLWFGAVMQAEGEYAYEIRPWNDRNRRVDISTHDFLGFYARTESAAPLWRIKSEGGSLVRITTLAGKAVGTYWDNAAWTSGRRGSYLRVGAVPAALFEIHGIQIGVAEPR
ncbi:hypothetical protein [Pseudomonas entomophila]|uniref:hypothetical protein n=1 Tax=Pseudomonas entomophila TaxID=312306 RepID=UPI00200D6678|nr:hypothetical protein [Pseudomonas entomophila]